MESKKTVVEWLQWELQGIHPLQIEWLQTFDQAKEMEKEQMKETAIHFFPTSLKKEHFEHYYNEKYGK